MINVNLLPKNLRRRREPGYWRLAAVVFPLLVVGIAGFMQYGTMQTLNRLEDDLALRRLRLDSLQSDLAELRNLNNRQQQLNTLIGIRNALADNRIAWSDQIYQMLENLPPRDEQFRPRIAFSQLTMQALNPSERQQRVQNNVYDGADVIAEMSVQGTVTNTQVLSDYIAALQRSALFEPSFNNTARQGDSNLYQFSLTVGAMGETGAIGEDVQ